MANWLDDWYEKSIKNKENKNGKTILSRYDCGTSCLSC
jgi:hypothetical protein